MKKIFLLLLILSFSSGLKSQNINGYIVSDTGNLTIVKIWGTHYERGFAYGYLCSGKIMSMMNDYILPQFGSSLTMARQVLQQGTSLLVDSVYYHEAQGLIDGLDAAGQIIGNLNYLDVIAANCMLDFMSMAGIKFKDGGPGCSSLMSWGAATAGTDLDDKSVISRHLDWSNDVTLINNQVIVIHIPSETNEQPWAMIGFAGQISALSGVNKHMGVFQHMMSDFSGTGQLNMGYEPVWFSLRKALELNDYNNDGVNNTKDMCDILSTHTNGYADGYIITMLASANNDTSGLIAQIAEIAAAPPYIIFRGNEFPDSINTDNLYAANYEIKRNNHYHFCTRYTKTMHAVDNGTNISSQRNWEILRDSSNSGAGNIQFMQFIPDEGILNIAVHKNGKAAYRNNPVTLYLNDLFITSTLVGPGNKESMDFILYPNPVDNKLYISVPNLKSDKLIVRITDISGKEVDLTFNKISSHGQNVYQTSTDQLSGGIYTCRIISKNAAGSKNFVKVKK